MAGKNLKIYCNECKKITNGNIEINVFHSDKTDIDEWELFIYCEKCDVCVFQEDHKA